MRGRRLQGRRAGLALILVLTILFALALIATPFVLSMITHAKTAGAETSRRQAGYGAEGIRNFAATRLLRGADHFERMESATPYVDAPSEFDVDVRDARLKPLNVRDPRGTIWGVTARDEQGKINVLSAPERILSSLRTLVGRRVNDLKEVLTLYSGRPARWVRPQKIRAIGVFGNPDDPSGPRMAGVRVDTVIQMGLGVRVRATKPGLPPFEATVIRNGIQFIGVSGVETNPRLPEKYLHGILEIEMRHPVNVNTARRETLAAMHDGLALSVPASRGFSGSRVHQVGPLEAQSVADGLYQKDIATWDRFLREVLRLDVSDEVKAAVIINAIDPGNLLLGDRREGRGSVGLCFTSNETVTIEAMASVNTHAGTPAGGAGFREVVDLGGPEVMTRSWENQFDFDRMMGPPRLMTIADGKLPPLTSTIAGILRDAGILGTGYAGYPFGSRMESFPMDLDKGEPSDMTLKPLQKNRSNYLSMRTERDHRGQGGFLHLVEHFDKDLDGLRIAPGAFTKQHGEAFVGMPRRPDAAAGGTEFWIRFERDINPALEIRLFDIRETDETNRISIALKNGQISYRITDASIGAIQRSLDKGWSEIRAPFLPEKETWYHITACWKGTRYGHMVLLIDGFIPPGAEWRYLDTDGRRVQSTELAAGINRPDDPEAPYTAILLKDTTWMVRPPGWPADRPWTVPIRIGSEVIEYDPALGVGRRGSRSTRATSHPLDAKVSLFGYTSQLQNYTVELEFPFGDAPGAIAMNFGPIRATQGAGAHSFGPCRSMYLVGEQRRKSQGKMLGKGVNKVNFQLMSDGLPCDTSEWPDSGFIRIEREAIYYRRIVRETKTTGYFDLCERGRAGTEDVSHMEGVPIELWSVAVSEPDPTLPTPTIVQFGEEWFGPAQLVQVPTGGPANFYWIGCVIEGQAVPFARGRFWGTETAFHERGEPLVPVFAAREIDPEVFRTNLRSLDPVTAIESTNYREQHRIFHATTVEELNALRVVDHLPGKDKLPPLPPPKNRGLKGVQLASFFEPTKRDFTVDGLHNRILKWPSGELIGERFLSLKNPTVSYGPADATLDEVKNMASPKAELELAEIADREERDLRMTGSSELDGHPCGLLLAGEELIGFPIRSETDELKRCTRAWLNSKRDVHDRGDAAFLLSFLPVSSLNEGSLTAVARTIPIERKLAGEDFTRGYVLINGEVIGFEERGDDGRELDTLAGFDGLGLFRGMFGTAPAVHPKHSMIFGIPYRYSGGYKPGEFDNRMAYFQVAHTTRDARWRGLRLEIERDGRDPNLLPRCLVRIDGIGHLTHPQVDDHSAVWRFSGSGAHSLEDLISGRLENGQIEARLFLDYEKGSYWPSNSWKRTVKIHEVRIDYDRDTRVVMHQD